MKMVMYTIFDTASAAYMRPLVFQTDKQALRVFKDIALDKNQDVGKHPEDYSLWRIGQFDDNKGELLPEGKECLATALELVAVAENVAADNGKDISFGGTA